MIHDLIFPEILVLIAIFLNCLIDEGAIFSGLAESEVSWLAEDNHLSRQIDLECNSFVFGTNNSTNRAKFGIFVERPIKTGEFYGHITIFIHSSILKFLIIHLLEIWDGKLKVVTHQLVNDIGLMNNYPNGKEVKNVLKLILRCI